MRLTVFNGSPRARGSNTRTLMDYFLAGFAETPGNRSEYVYLAAKKDFSDCARVFAEAETVILAFPLYTDCVPAAVKEFIEALEPLAGRAGNPALGFIVHSGFPESFHSHPVRRYLEKLACRLGCACLGTVIKGGSEAVRGQPENMNRRLFELFHRLGTEFGRSGRFDPRLVEKLARPVRHRGIGVLLAAIGNKVAELLYWNRLLRKNGAFDRRFARPYAGDG
ncbi:MAG: NAD(P)H-dependent oxidoreductase [Candidatus Glassbacteria bacterium]